jgi:hypothetical protein
LLSFNVESFVLQFAIQKYILKVYRTVIFPVVSYGFEIWYLTLRKEHRLRVFENRWLWKIFGHKRDDKTREWGSRNKERLYDLYSSPNIIRLIKSRMR